MLRKLITSVLFFVIAAGALAQNPFDEMCLTTEELELAKAINAYRVENEMPEIPLSRSLCYVADVHAKDLYFFYNERSRASMHSWSANGRWNECTYSNPRTDGRCMHNKPSELTDYQGLGFELAYRDNTDQATKNAFDAWINNEITRKVILNEGSYLTFDWNAMGVKAFNGYVLVWFGTITDKADPVYPCGQTPESDSLSAPDLKPQKLFYVVVASYYSQDDAEKDKIRWEKRFFEPLKVLKNNDKYRLAVGAYNDNAAAEKALKEIRKQVRDAWIISL